ncbi:peroxisomal membrane anchor protein (Pex14p) conserved region domain-containing protein [Rhizoctonia solani AG-1 IA]|uniref:Peroxisomal membrane anchor protein (Pex14p) conserved region domain-containing protein n=1 Tax=Thanatephorus cucumeris (strain AG1-IA) TaxID=983506 RepID=L8X358_THACA|nr:peroxisomal membrane anchor protein (Pex14p) conserved region domain-containing protein [Rhizoctonia solani AG-1 IA]
MSTMDTHSQPPEMQPVVSPSTDPVEITTSPKESQEPQATTQPVATTPLTQVEQFAFEEQQKSSDLVSKAQSFLESPELKESDSKSKAQYLADKGLSGDTIDELQQAKFVFPRWVKMIRAKQRLREHQIGLLNRLTEQLSEHRIKCLNPSMIAPSEDSKPVIASQLQNISSQIPPTPSKTSRQHALQSLSDLTGYLSSQIHLTSALDAAARAYNFQFSMPGATSTQPKNEIHEQLKKDIRSLKGLLINRFDIGARSCKEAR